MGNEIFVIFNTTSIGDVLVTNTLVRNIRYYYPKSYIVFVCNTPIRDVAKYQEGVNEVVTLDKNNINSLIKIANYASKFPYKKPFASIITYANERNLLIARLIGSKHVISRHKFRLWNTREKYELKDYVHMNDRWGGLIEPLTGEHKTFGIKYNAPFVENHVTEKIKTLKNPVALSPTSNLAKKDMSVEDCAELITLLNRHGYTPVMTGAGSIAREFNAKLKKYGCFDFIDIVDCTSFVELANVLKICNLCISVDTGTLHFANALNVPVVGVFYADCSEMWGSDPNLYPSIILDGVNVLPKDIMLALKDLSGVYA